MFYLINYLLFTPEPRVRKPHFFFFFSKTRKTVDEKRANNCFNTNLFVFGISSLLRWLLCCRSGVLLHRRRRRCTTVAAQEAVTRVPRRRRLFCRCRPSTFSLTFPSDCLCAHKRTKLIIFARVGWRESSAYALRTYIENVAVAVVVVDDVETLYARQDRNDSTVLRGHRHRHLRRYSFCSILFYCYFLFFFFTFSLCSSTLSFSFHDF